MALEDRRPEPPSLSGPQYRGDFDAIDDDVVDGGDDYRLDELAAILEDGAWEDAFGEWAATSGLAEADFAAVVDRGYVERFDFYWDPGTDDVGYHAPTIPEADEAAFGDADATEVESELDSLGRVVTEVLENDYLLRDDPEEGYGFFAETDAGDESADDT